MTELEDDAWRQHLCQNCGSHLGEEQCVLRLSDSLRKAYCSTYCRYQAAKPFLSELVFQAPKRMSLRDHILRSSHNRPV
jgi:hypothetical protein